MVCRFRLVGRGRSDGCCAGPSKGGRGQLARMVWSPPWLRKNTGDLGFELDYDTPIRHFNVLHGDLLLGSTRSLHKESGGMPASRLSVDVLAPVVTTVLQLPRGTSRRAPPQICDSLHVLFRTRCDSVATLALPGIGA